MGRRPRARAHDRFFENPKSDVKARGFKTIPGLRKKYPFVQQGHIMNNAIDTIQWHCFFINKPFSSLRASDGSIYFNTKKLCLTDCSVCQAERLLCRFIIPHPEGEQCGRYVMILSTDDGIVSMNDRYAYQLLERAFFFARLFSYIFISA